MHKIKTTTLAILLASFTNSSMAGLTEVNVFTAKDAHELPKYGGNMTYMDKGSNVIDDNLQLTHLADKIKEIQPDWVRFPGGTAIDTYIWERAISLYPEDREDQVHPFRIRHSPTPSLFGPIEAAELVDLWGGEIIGTVNVNRSANEAARFVEFMTAEEGTNPRHGEQLVDRRVAAFRNAPINMKVVEVGNEIGGGEKDHWFSYDTDEYPENYLANEALLSDNDLENDPAPELISRKYKLSDPNDDYGPGLISQQEKDAYKEHIFNDGGQRQFKNQILVKKDAYKPWLARTASAIAPEEERKNQEFYVKFPPAKDITITINGEEWERAWPATVTNAESKVFWMDRDSGKVTFGDGVNGAIPPAEQNIFADYTTIDHDGFKTFEDLMKKANPNIKVVGTAWALRKEFKDNPAFEIDGLQWHDGDWLSNKSGWYPHPKINDNELHPYDVCIGRAFGTFSERLTDDDHRTNTYDPDDATKNRTTGHYITEYSYSRNLEYDTSPEGEVNHGLTHCSSLLHAGILMEASRLGTVEYIGANYLINTENTSLAEVMIDQEGTVTAMGRAFQLFTQHFGDTKLEEEYVRWNNRKVHYYEKSWKQRGFHPLQEEQIENVQILASRDENANYVMVMNTSHTTSHDVKINYDIAQGLVNESPIVQLQAKSGNLFKSNSAQEPDNVRIVNLDDLPTWNADGKSLSYTVAPATITVFKTSNI